MSMFGGGMAFAIGPLLITLNTTSGSEYGFLTLLATQGAIATVLLLLIVAFFQDRPPTPPIVDMDDSINNDPQSDPYAISRNQSFLEASKAVLLNPHFLVLMICFACCNAFFQSFATVLTQIIVPKGYTIFDGSKFSVLSMVCTIIGGFTIGVLADRTKRFKLIACTTSFLSVCGFGLFAVIMMWKRTEFLFFIACIANATIGLTIIPTIPVLLEMMTEVTFPVLPSTSASILGGFGTIFSLMYLVVINILQLITTDSSQIILWIDLGLLTCEFVLLVLFRGKFLRTNHEAKRIIPSSDDIVHISAQKNEFCR